MDTMKRGLSNFISEFLSRIKVRIALSFSVLFIVVAVPVIIYALSQVRLFFTGMYIKQMETAGLLASSMNTRDAAINYDSLAAGVSRASECTVYLISKSGEIISTHQDISLADTAQILSIPILNSSQVTPEPNIKRKFIEIGFNRYLKVQVDFADGKKLLMVKSLTQVSLLLGRMTEVIIWGSFLGLVALVAVAFWVSAMISHTIEELTVFTRRIRTEELPEKTNIKSPDEVGELADALNDMVDNLKQLRIRVAQLENIRREFFANVSARLKDPIADLKNIIQNMGNKLSSGKSIDGGELTSALNQANKLDKIISTLIDISKIEYGEAMIEFRGFRIGTMIYGMIGPFKELAKTKGLNLEVDLPNGNEKIFARGDEKLIRMAMENLVENALDNTQKGYIKISCIDEDTRVKIIIEDSGSGIAEDQIPRIFERFYRLEPTDQNSGEHLGLGLAIVKHVIDAHEQKIEVESKLGIGSKFSFWLKRYDRSFSKS